MKPMTKNRWRNVKKLDKYLALPVWGTLLIKIWGIWMKIGSRSWRKTLNLEKSFQNWPKGSFLKLLKEELPPCIFNKTKILAKLYNRWVSQSPPPLIISTVLWTRRKAPNWVLSSSSCKTWRQTDRVQKQGPSERLVKNMTLNWQGANKGPFGPISKNMTPERCANDALMVRY